MDGEGESAMVNERMRWAALAVGMAALGVVPIQAAEGDEAADEGGTRGHHAGPLTPRLIMSPPTTPTCCDSTSLGRPRPVRTAKPWLRKA